MCREMYTSSPLNDGSCRVIVRKRELRTPFLFPVLLAMGGRWDMIAENTLEEKIGERPRSSV